MLAFVIICFLFSDLRVIVLTCNTRNEPSASCQSSGSHCVPRTTESNWPNTCSNFCGMKYQVELQNIVIDAPPKVEMGEFAMPFSFELAKQLRKAPRTIAEEIVAEMPVPEGFEKFEVAGAGYINARLKREHGRSDADGR